MAALRGGHPHDRSRSIAGLQGCQARAAPVGRDGGAPDCARRPCQAAPGCTSRCQSINMQHAQRHVCAERYTTCYFCHSRDMMCLKTCHSGPSYMNPRMQQSQSARSFPEAMQGCRAARSVDESKQKSVPNHETPWLRVLPFKRCICSPKKVTAGVLCCWKLFCDQSLKQGKC